MALIPWYRPRDAQPLDGAHLDGAHPLAARIHTAYMPGIGLTNFAAGGAALGGLATHAAPPVDLACGARAASIVVTNQRLTSSRSFGPTPAYPLTMIWVGQQGSTVNTQLAGITNAAGSIGGSYCYIGGGSSTLISYQARNNFGSALALYASPPGGSAINTDLVVVVQSLSASDHRMCVNGGAVATATTNVGAMVAWDRAFVGQSASANNQATALLAVASGGVPLTDEQMQALARDPSAVWALFEPEIDLVPAEAESEGTTLTPDVATLTLAGLAPTLGQPKTVQPDAAMLALAGHAPTVAQPVSLQPAPAVLALSGLAPDIGQPVSVQPGAATLSLVGHAPAIGQSTGLTPDPATLALQGHAPTVGQPVTVQPAPAVLTLGGHAPTVTQILALQPDAAQIIVAGLAPAIGQPKTLTPDPAVLTLAGAAPTITQSQALSPDAAVLTLLGLAPQIGQPRTVAPGVATITLTGHAPVVSQVEPGTELHRGRRVVAIPRRAELRRTVYVHPM